VPEVLGRKMFMDNGYLAIAILKVLMNNLYMAFKSVSVYTASRLSNNCKNLDFEAKS
jgi:hypothetical protein